MENKELIVKRLKNFYKIEAKEIISHESLTQKEAERFFEENRIVIHSELGSTIFAKTTVGKLIKHKGFDTATIIKLLPSLYKDSIFIESQTEKEFENKSHKKHTNIKFWHNTLNKFKIKNEHNNFDNYTIRFTITEQYAGKKKKKGNIGERTFHSTNISKIYIEKDGDVINTGTIPGKTYPSDKVLAHYLEIVKTK